MRRIFVHVEDSLFLLHLLSFLFHFTFSFPHLWFLHRFSFSRRIVICNLTIRLHERISREFFHSRIFSSAKTRTLFSGALRSRSVTLDTIPSTKNCFEQNLREHWENREREIWKPQKFFGSPAELQAELCKQNFNIKIDCADMESAQSTYLKQIDEKIELANTLIDKLEKDFPKIEGSVKTRRNIQKEIKFLEKVCIFLHKKVKHLRSRTN